MLCANAGIFPPAKLEDMTSEEWDLVVDTNLKGTFHSVKAAVPYLKKSDQGRIVLTSSITGPVTGFPGWTHYGATKAGQLGFMRTACIELAKYGITVNAVMPGNIITEGLAGMGEDYQRSMAASVPLKKLGHGRGHRLRRALLRLEGSELRDRPDHHRRWRPDPAGEPRGAEFERISPGEAQLLERRHESVRR